MEDGGSKYTGDQYPKLSCMPGGGISEGIGGVSRLWDLQVGWSEDDLLPRLTFPESALWLGLNWPSHGNLKRLLEWGVEAERMPLMV